MKLISEYLMGSPKTLFPTSPSKPYQIDQDNKNDLRRHRLISGKNSAQCRRNRDDFEQLFIIILDTRLRAWTRLLSRRLLSLVYARCTLPRYRSAAIKKA